VKFKGIFASHGCRRALFLALVSGASCAGSGCRSRTEPSPHGARDAGISRGEQVVVEASAAEFFEARVIEVATGELRVQAVAGGESRRVVPSDVYRLTTPASVPTGFAICRGAPSRWIGCRIDSVDDARVRAVDLQGNSLTLASGDVLVPNAVTELNLRHAFRESDRRIGFERDVERAGRPHAPRGWRPSPQERVLARDGRAWYSARIHEIEDERLHVRWQTDERITELGYADVVPEPPYPTPPERGAIVLVRPNVIAQAWAPMRVKTTGAEIGVEDAAGARKTVSLRDVVVLSRP
jgi:hypothetical protein